MYTCLHDRKTFFRIEWNICSITSVKSTARICVVAASICRIPAKFSYINVDILNDISDYFCSYFYLKCSYLSVLLKKSKTLYYKMSRTRAHKNNLSPQLSCVSCYTCNRSWTFNLCLKKIANEMHIDAENAKKISGS